MTDPTSELRTTLRRARRRLSAATQARHALALRDHLLVIPAIRTGRRIGVYLADDGEIDLGPSIASLWRRGREVLAPVAADDETLELRVFNDFDTLSPGRFGIAAPHDGAPRRLDEIDVLVVPVVAVDRAANRVGRGRGYYDRLLATPAPRRPLLVAVAHRLQVVDAVIPHPWDRRCDVVVTEQGLVAP